MGRKSRHGESSESNKDRKGDVTNSDVALISTFCRDRARMIGEAFLSLSENEIRQILPDCLENLSVSELKECAIKESKNVSRSNLRRVTKGKSIKKCDRRKKKKVKAVETKQTEEELTELELRANAIKALLRAQQKGKALPLTSSPPVANDDEIFDLTGRKKMKESIANSYLNKC